MHSNRPWLALGLSAWLVAGCTALSPSKPVASASMESRSGSPVTGVASFLPSRTGLVLHIELSGLSPGSEHGLHVHEKGDCSAPDAQSAGGHFNPEGAVHGHAGTGPHHAGDLGAVVADGAGRVNENIPLTELTLTDGPHAIVGRSLVLHRDRDDYVTQPAGNAGPRIACGVIVAR
jgi:superoxide dismutase, Cu-Zn family